MTLGSLLGLGALGLYTRAAGLPGQVMSNVFGAASNVIFSRLSSDLRDHGEIHPNYLHFMRLLLGILWPMMIGIAVLAHTFHLQLEYSPLSYTKFSKVT